MGSWGALIMGFFGAIFASMTLYAQCHGSGLILISPFIGFGIIGLLAAYVIRQPGEGIVPSERASKAIRWSSIGEGIGLFLASNIVINLHHPEFLMPAMALVVGLHFLPIAYAASFSPFYALGGALILFGLIGFIVTAPLGGAISGFASAGGLWIASALALRRDIHFKRGNRSIKTACTA
ncbi:hypothetical protein AD951_05935 [Acetobacter malorum]|uniref:Uncharacterized protein n=2 Tax=Acetobacter malorum TaxID=178901 RepID=A0A149V346_9PROT|nr:hypothetical protein AD951_05935 [Acetobacter malorum]KXV74641.1 hypothetical protein AD953_10850 [Acetobacter malorum]